MVETLEQEKASHARQIEQMVLDVEDYEKQLEMLARDMKDQDY